MMDEQMMTENESSPIDGMIEELRMWEKDPKLVTAESIAGMIDQLTDLKGVVDEEEEPEPSKEMQKGEKPSIVIALGLRKGKGNMNKGEE